MSYGYQKRLRRTSKPIIFLLRCGHGVVSGRPCRLCGDVVPPLSGRRPWWTPVWRAWHVVAGVLGL